MCFKGKVRWAVTRHWCLGHVRNDGLKLKQSTLLVDSVHVCHHELCRWTYSIISFDYWLINYLSPGSTHAVYAPILCLCYHDKHLLQVWAEVFLYSLSMCYVTLCIALNYLWALFIIFIDGRMFNSKQNSLNEMSHRIP